MRRYDWVLIDGDNTLLDFDAAQAQALGRTMEARGLSPTPEALARYAGINQALWDAYARGEIDRERLRAERFRRFGAWLGWRGDPAAWDREYMAALGECGALLPGAVELLAALKPHCRVGLASNGSTQVQRQRLEGSPLLPYLDGVFLSQEMGVNKPEAAFFHRAMAALGAVPERTVMVGDDLLSDIQGAVNAGIDSIWYSPRGAESPLPTWRVTRLEDVAKIVLGERMRGNEASQ